MECHHRLGTTAMPINGILLLRLCACARRLHCSRLVCSWARSREKHFEGFSAHCSSQASHKPSDFPNFLLRSSVFVAVSARFGVLSAGHIAHEDELRLPRPSGPAARQQTLREREGEERSHHSFLLFQGLMTGF